MDRLKNILPWAPTIAGLIILGAFLLLTYPGSRYVPTEPVKAPAPVTEAATSAKVEQPKPAATEDKYSAYYKANDAATKRKEDALSKCRSEKGYPVLGFGMSVVCLKKENVLWGKDPQYPELP